MNNLYYDILDNSEKLCFDVKLKSNLANNISNWQANFKKSANQFSDLQSAEEKLASIRGKALYNLENTVFEFEEKFKSNKGIVHFAQTEKDVSEIVNRIIKTKKVKNVVYNSGVILNDLGLKESINKKNLEITELNIDNSIAAIKRKKNISEHYTFPTISMDKDSILQVCAGEYTVDENMTTQELLNVIANDKDKKIRKSELFISGVNYLVPDTGTIVIIDNEGLFKIANLFSKTKIFIATIEQIINNIFDLDTLLPMYSTYSKGQKIAPNNILISGPTNKEGEEPEEIHVIITNNRRIQVLNDVNIRSSLNCIACGACLNVCPIYKCGSGEMYRNTYPGPLGLVYNPVMKSKNTFSMLPYMCTLCGKCTEICPVKIDFPSLIIQMRKNIVEEQYSDPDDERYIKELYSRTMKRKKMDRRGASFKKRKLTRLTQGWGEWRDLPEFAKKSFSSQYVEMKSKESEEENKKMSK